MIRHTFLCCLAVALVFITAAQAQSPAPLVVQAVSPANANSPATSGANTEVKTSASVVTAIKVLEGVKAANAETVKQQEALLERLDDLQKAADQLKIFSRRTGG
jgi:uncharacterized membrane protein